MFPLVFVAFVMLPCSLAASRLVRCMPPQLPAVDMMAAVGIVLRGGRFSLQARQ